MKKIIALLSTIMLLIATTVIAEATAEFEMEYCSGKIVIENSGNSQSDCVLIAAQYSGDKVVKVVTYDVKPPYSNIELYNDFDDKSTIKCMLWDSVSGMKPVADAIDITLDMEPALMSEMPSAGAGPLAMIVDEVEAVVDALGETAYSINGYIDGDKVQVTTNINTIIGVLTPNVWTSSNNGRNFDALTVWNSTEDYKDTDVSGILEKGSIILYTPDCRVVAIFSNVQELSNYVFDIMSYTFPLGNKQNKSAARVGYYFEAAEDIGIAEKVWLKLKDIDDRIIIDDSKKIDLVEINNVTREATYKEGGITADKIIPYDAETKTGDYVYVSTANVGDLNDVVVYRFVPENGEVASPDIDISKETTRLTDGEKYAWLMDVYESSTADIGTVAQLYTQDGEAVEMSFAQTVDYWAPEAENAENISSTDLVEKLQLLLESNGFIKGYNDTPIRFVKYKTDENNAITKFYCAVDSARVTSDDAVIIDTYNLGGVLAKFGAVNGYLVADGIIEFNVPWSVDGMSKARNYSVGTVEADNYIMKETGSSRQFFVGEFVNGIDSTVVINFVDNIDTPASMTAMDSSGSGPSAMVINEVRSVIDNAGDKVCGISGYIDGFEMYVTTQLSTTVGELTPDVWTTTNSGRNYDAPTVWNTTTEYAGIGLDTILKKGDIILYTSDGKLIAKFADAEGFKDYILNGAEYNLPIGSKPNRFAARVGYYFNALESVEGNDIASIKLKDYDTNVLFDSGKYIDLVTISKSNGVSIDLEGASVYDLIPYNEETKEGDYVYVSTANKGQTNNIVVYRFTE